MLDQNSIREIAMQLKKEFLAPTPAEVTPEKKKAIEIQNIQTEIMIEIFARGIQLYQEMLDE